MSNAGYQCFDPLLAEFIDTTVPPQCIASGMRWTEGPVWLNGSLYFNDIPSRKMMRWSRPAVR